MNVLCIIPILLIITTPMVYAHPFTEESWPNADESAEVGTTQVWLRYSEEVVLDFSSLKVYDSQGAQIDNRDTAHYTNDRTLVVTTPPLTDGIYTVSSKVLSAVDGHLVPDTILFAVGSSTIDVGLLQQEERELVYMPEAIVRFFGLAGQTILLGAIIGAALVWRTQDKRLIHDHLDLVNRIHHDKFMLIIGISLIAVLASTIMTLVVYTLRLGTFSGDTLLTSFGLTWVARMIVVGILLAAWFVMERRMNERWYAVMLALTMGLLWTSSMIGHGAATGQAAPLILDFIHGLVSAAWIGGLGYICFILYPALLHAKEMGREKMMSILVPRFSTIFVLGVGVVLITGPTLMWFFESDVGVITDSLYGKLIMAKIALASVMVGLGGYLQLTISNAVKRGRVQIFKKMRHTLRTEFALGIILLGVVAVLINGTLPSGEIDGDTTVASDGFRTVKFTENAKFEIELEPYTIGLNGIYVSTTNLDGSPVEGQSGIHIKVSNPEKNIFPFSMELEPTASAANEYSGEAVFGFAGTWVVEVESQREEGGNESVIMNLPIKPDMHGITATITEYDLPQSAKPLYPVYHNDHIWISDPSAPRLWSFDLANHEFESFTFDGGVSLFLDVDHNGNIWFTDAPGGQIGYLQPTVGEFTLIPIPELGPVDLESVITAIRADHNGNIWTAVTTKDAILYYNTQNETFQIFYLERGSFPFALSVGPRGNVWFTASGNGDIGYIQPESGEIKVFAAREPLANPEYLLFDQTGTLWISEHTGTGLVRFDEDTGAFTRVPLGVDGGLPYGTSLDVYGNIWVAQHTADVVVIYDIQAETYRHIPIPTNGSFTQFMTADNDQNIWFVEQQTNKLAKITTTTTPSTEIPPRIVKTPHLLYAEVASPLMAAGILASALFFVKSVQDKRRAEYTFLNDAPVSTNNTSN
ncbi:MAG: copper resistance protein CopD [Cenarchaeum sp. SB0665_bin_23]|nr:copper resistance protein CopD [Cenarchaeum sp. SB0665_bin_23]MYG33354.1 copper resistance protein CopD [Cenarchaeum sp. SB0677_bin_16]